MAHFFSQRCRHALRALLFMATQPPDQYISIRVLSRFLKLPEYSLAKIFQVLVRHGILESYKGPSGGFKFSRDTQDILLNDIVTAIDGNELQEQCLLEHKPCSDENPCPLHHIGKGIRFQIRYMLNNVSIRELQKMNHLYTMFQQMFTSDYAPSFGIIGEARCGRNRQGGN